MTPNLKESAGGKGMKETKKSVKRCQVVQKLDLEGAKQRKFTHFHSRNSPIQLAGTGGSGEETKKGFPP